MADETEVRKGLTGNLYSAPLGTTMPTNTTIAMSSVDAAWVELGYTSEDGLSMSTDNTTEGHTPWQALRPVRYDTTNRSEMFTFTLWQRNAETLRQAFGGGTVVAGTGDDVIYTPPSSAAQFERAYVFEVIDGDIIDRYLCQRGTPTLNGDVPFTKADITQFEIQVTVLDSAGDSWSLITNDPAVDVDAS